MKATIRDIETLRAVQPLDLVSYLRANGWHQADAAERSATWIKEGMGDELEILLPLDSKLRDYPNRIADVLAALELSEKRSQLDIVDDLITTSADVVRPRLLGVNHVGEITLEQGRIVYDQARNLMLAAACAAVEKRSLFAKRKSERAMSFLNHARFGMPQRGSYILTIISPVSPKISLGADLLGDEMDIEPFERRTMRTLAEAISALESASREVAATGELRPMRTAVLRGVSANLCEAILGLHDGSGEMGVEFSFSWAPLRGVPPGVPRVVSVLPDFIPLIRETARIFRETETVDDTEVIGVVSALKHQGENNLVTITGMADGVTRNVQARLSGVDHSMAVDSYEKRIPISCTGELTREGKSWTLQNPREVRLLQGDWVSNL